MPRVRGIPHAREILDWWPYFVPRWRDFEGFSLRSKIKVGLDAKWGGFKVWI